MLNPNPFGSKGSNNKCHGNFTIVHSTSWLNAAKKNEIVKESRNTCGTDTLTMRIFSYPSTVSLQCARHNSNFALPVLTSFAGARAASASSQGTANDWWAIRVPMVFGKIGTIHPRASAKVNCCTHLRELTTHPWKYWLVIPCARIAFEPWIIIINKLFPPTRSACLALQRGRWRRWPTIELLSAWTSWRILFSAVRQL